MASVSLETSDCDDFLAFQELLKQSRKVEDNIIHTLNTTVPTESFADRKDAHATCKDLYSQLELGYSSRLQAIKRCIAFSEQQLRTCKEAKEKNTDDFRVIKELKKEQTKYRLLRTELGVEEVVTARTKKAFHERCRFFFNPV